MSCLALAVSVLFQTEPLCWDNVYWLCNLPACAAESLSRLNISVISFPQAIMSPQTVQLKGKRFNHWDNLYKKNPWTSIWALCFHYLLFLSCSYAKYPLCQPSSGDYWLLTGTAWPWRAQWPCSKSGTYPSPWLADSCCYWSTAATDTPESVCQGCLSDCLFGQTICVYHIKNR